MRKVFAIALAAVVVFGSTPLQSAIPQVLNYQGILRNASGIPVGDGSHSVTFRFYDVEAGGTPLWEETQIIVTKAGLFNVLLGSVNPVPETVFETDAWLGISIGSDPEVLPRLQVASVGYAYKARNAELLQGLGPGELTYPTTPGMVFHRCVRAPAGTTHNFGSVGGIRQITGVSVASTSQSLSWVTIGTTVAIHLVIPSAGGSFLWSSASGAPIQINAGESLSVTASGSNTSDCYITITGFEY